MVYNVSEQKGVLWTEGNNFTEKLYLLYGQSISFHMRDQQKQGAGKVFRPPLPFRHDPVLFRSERPHKRRKYS